MARRRQAYVNLDEPVFDAFVQAAATAYPGQPFTAALREAALLWLGTEPTEAARAAARRQAWLEGRVTFARAVGEAMAKISAEFNQTANAALEELREVMKAA